MVDEHMGLWLIEVNSNPAITQDCSKLLSRLIRRMVDNAFALAVEPDNEHLRQYRDDVNRLRGLNIPTIPTTLNTKHILRIVERLPTKPKLPITSMATAKTLEDSD